MFDGTGFIPPTPEDDNEEERPVVIRPPSFDAFWPCFLIAFVLVFVFL